MQQTASRKRKTRPSREAPPAPRRRERAGGRAPDARRPQAAGIAADDAPVEDIDAFRNMVARRIAMLIGQHERCWRTCKEAGCRRARACLAPKIECSNAPPLPPDPDGRLLARGQAGMLRALRAAQEMQKEQEAQKDE